MSAQFASFWQAVLLIGRTVFPYVGMVVLVILAILALVLVLYLLYRVVRRLPVSFRHVVWRVGTAARRLFAWVRRGRVTSHAVVLACFHDSTRPAVPLQDSFQSAVKGMPWTRKSATRPQEPLYLVIGPAGAGKSTLLSKYVKDAVRAKNVPGAPAPVCDLTWWRLKQGWALEVNAQFAEGYDSPKFSSMLRILEEMRPDRPVDGLIVVAPAAQLAMEGVGARLGHAMGAAASLISMELGYSLPTRLVISGTDVLTGFESLVKLCATGEDLDFPLGLLLPPPSSAAASPSLPKSLHDAVLGRVLFALSSQADLAVNFSLRSVLALPTEILRLQAALETFDQRLSEALRGAALRGVLLTGFSSIESSAERELVLAGERLGQQLFVQHQTQEPGKAYQARVDQQLRRRKTVVAACVASCAIVLVGSSLTWKRMGEDVALIQRVLGEVGPEMHVARNSYLTLASSVGISSLERLINTVAALDSTSVTYSLVPSSWTSEFRNDALASVGEVISRTLIRARMEVLSSNVPQAYDSAVMSDGGLSAQRIEDLPAYQQLVSFIDYQESTWASMDSGERLAKRISYGDFLGFLGIRPEQTKLRRLNWSDPMPAGVTQRFHVESLRSPENDALVRQVVDGYWDRLLSQAFEQNPVVVVGEALVEDVRTVGGVGVFGAQEAQELGARLKRLKREAALPSSRRVLGAKSEALAFFAKVQFRLGASSVVSSGQMVDLASALDKRFDLLRSRMVQLESDGIGLLFTADAREGTLQLSADLKRFGGAYATFMAQPFMQPTGKMSLQMPGSGQYVEWSLPGLEPVRSLADAYRDYSGGAAGQAFDSRLKAGLLRLARSNFLKQADVLFMQAAKIRDEGALPADTTGVGRGRPDTRRLTARTANLAAAGKFYRMLQPTDNAGLNDSAVGELLANETIQLLRQFEAELVKDDPYGLLNAEATAWVNGGTEGKAALNTFKVNAKDRLVSAREYVRVQYGTLALPLVDFLSGGGHQAANDEIVVRWSRMRETQDGYQKGNASNGISELERYILGLTKLRTPDECAAFLEERQPFVQRGDYFSRQLAALDASIVTACEQRHLDAMRRHYENFASWFNSAVAGRYPFSPNGWRSASVPITVPVFERLLSLHGELKLQIESAGRLSSSLPAEVTRFMARMDMLGAFFLARSSTPQAAVQPTGSAAKPSAVNEGVRADIPFRARLIFRSNRAQEAGADQIIEWTVNSGGRRYSSRSNDLFQWKIGEPIEVKLRWATNSPVSPVVTSQNPYTHSVEEKSATFRYTGDWALFEMLDRHAANPTNGDGGHALSFRIPTIGPEGRHDTKAFITMMPPEGRGPLVPEFPAMAPVLPRSWSRS